MKLTPAEGATILVGDVLEQLASLPDESVDCVVTSPPYWGLRDYSVEGQIGLEATPDLYVARMVEVFREVRRVLAPYGTCWVNLGDSYANDTKWGGTTGGKHVSDLHGGSGGLGRGKRDTGLKAKDLVGVPWRVAFALQQDGWYLRSDIIWAKPNPMPESVTDRPTKSHEYLFLLTKSPRYWFDQEAVREPSDAVGPSWGQRKAAGEVMRHGLSGAAANGSGGYGAAPGGRNVRSVWEIATQPYPEAHFATFPEELPRRAIRAGCPLWVCRVCGKPWERPQLATGETNGRDRGNAVDFFPEKGGNPSGIRTLSGATYKRQREAGEMEPTCDCATKAAPALGVDGQQGSTSQGPPSPGSAAAVDAARRNARPGVVLDPFMGSGTTLVVALRERRQGIGIELNPEYAELAARRISRWWDTPRRAPEPVQAESLFDLA